jgi:16S rRNA (uracil1498-N3)-methyltransferase
VELPEAAAHHALRVLRLSTDDVVRLFDGRGHEFTGRIAAIERGRVRVRVDDPLEPLPEPSVCIHLVQGISSGERMDYALQKATELGVASIQPVVTERSVVRLAGERAQRRQDHWQRVVIAACEQCGRSHVPEVKAILSLGDWLARDSMPSCRILLTPTGERRLADLPRPAAALVLLVGPEGGLADNEQDLARARGFIGVRLGPRILRTETAAAAAMAAIHALWGDF